MKYEIGTVVEAKSGALTNWYEGVIVGFDDTIGIYVLRMCEEYPFNTRYAGFREGRLRDVEKPPEPDFTVSEKDDQLVELVLNTFFSVVDQSKPGSEKGVSRLVIDTEQFKQNLEDAQIEAKAEELFYVFHTGDETRSWGRLVNKSGFRAIARHLATPQTDVQVALDEALKSERELRAELEAHQHNSKQILRLNNWLQEHNQGEWGDSVTDTIIKLLEKAVEPKQPTPQLINMCRVMNAIHIKHELRDDMTEDRIIENLEALHRDAAEGESFRKFAINNLDFGPHIKPNQLRAGLSKRHENYKSMQKALKEISVVIKTV